MRNWISKCLSTIIILPLKKIIKNAYGCLKARGSHAILLTCYIWNQTFRVIHPMYVAATSVQKNMFFRIPLLIINAGNDSLVRLRGELYSRTCSKVSSSLWQIPHVGESLRLRLETMGSCSSCIDGCCGCCYPEVKREAGGLFLKSEDAFPVLTSDLAVSAVSFVIFFH